MTKVSLDDLLKAISNAISGSSGHLQQRELDNHKSFFDSDDKGVLTPKTMPMLLPNRHHQATADAPAATESIHNVPQSTLVHNSQVALDTVSMEIDCLVEELKDGDKGEKQLVLHLGADVRNHSRGIKLNLTYKNSGTPEGVAKVNDELLKQF
jgi:hypothetical protein